MVGIVWLAVAVVVCLGYLVLPLVAESVGTPWDQFNSDRSDSTAEREQTPTRLTNTDSRRAMTDGGRVCHNCGSYVEGDYLYCGDCLTPRV